MTLKGDVTDPKMIVKWAKLWKALIYAQWQMKHSPYRGHSIDTRTLWQIWGWRYREALPAVGLNWKDYEKRPAQQAIAELVEMCLQLAVVIEEPVQTPSIAGTSE
jgi:hypothetical protein